MLHLPHIWRHRSPDCRHTDIIEPYLSEVLAQPIRITSRVRRPARRAVREPLLEAYGPDGPVGHVKIGDSGRAGELVRHESEILRMLADRPLKIVVPPTVVHHGVEQGLDVLLLSPLPVMSRRVPTDLLNAAITEIAPLGGNGEIINTRSEEAQSRGRLARDLQDHPKGCTAAWHGDLTPRNVALGLDGRLLVWNWERFGTGVPFGFDALHHFFHRCLRRMRPQDAARACIAQAGRILEPFGGPLPSGSSGLSAKPGAFGESGMPVAEARRIAAHYLITLADRHLRDGHEPLGPPAEWLNPVVDHLECLL